MSARAMSTRIRRCVLHRQDAQLRRGGGRTSELDPFERQRRLLNLDVGRLVGDERPRVKQLAVEVVESAPKEGWAEEGRRRSVARAMVGRGGGLCSGHPEATKRTQDILVGHRERLIRPGERQKRKEMKVQGSWECRGCLLGRNLRKHI